MNMNNLLVYDTLIRVYELMEETYEIKEKEGAFTLEGKNNEGVTFLFTGEGLSLRQIGNLATHVNEKYELNGVNIYYGFPVWKEEVKEEVEEKTLEAKAEEQPAEEKKVEKKSKAKKKKK